MYSARDFVITPEELVDDLLRKFDEWDKLPKDKLWTNEIKKYLAVRATEIGASLDDEGSAVKPRLEQISTFPERQVSEFLLDAVWWRRGLKNDRERIALAAEFEWAGVNPKAPATRDSEFVGNRVEYDFQKLVVVKSPLKLMVFTSAACGDESLEAVQGAVMNRLNAVLKRNADYIPGEIYLVIDTAVKGFRKSWIARMCADRNTPSLISFDEYRLSKSPEARAERIRLAQESAAKYAHPGVSWSEELIAERREEARLEGLDFIEARRIRAARFAGEDVGGVANDRGKLVGSSLRSE